MKKVYIVFLQEGYDPISEVMGVFSSKAKAIEFIETCGYPEENLGYTEEAVQ